MKKKSLYLILNIRYKTSFLYYIAMLFYGLLIINLYGKEDIGLKNGVIIIGCFFIALICIMAKSETLLKYADPLNFKNRKRYIIIFFSEISEILVAYWLAINKSQRYFYSIIYYLYITSILILCIYIHRKIRTDYNKLKSKLKLKLVINQYLNYLEQNKYNLDEINDKFKNFIKFTVYIIVLSVVYKYTLHSWILTIIFMFMNFYMLWKFHWEGIEKLIKYAHLYFVIICLISTCGILLLKLIYDKIINLLIFVGRDEQEYFMVLVLFYFPIMYYGSKVSIKYINSNCGWIE